MKFARLLAISLFLVSCQSKKIETITPPPIVEKQPSWDHNTQNSGLIEYKDGVGFIITHNAASRYIYLTGKHGDKLSPPVTAGQGLIEYPPNFVLSAQYMSVFMEVSKIEKNAK